MTSQIRGVYGRRRFLTVGAAGASALAASVAATGSALGRLAEVSSTPATVGYWRGSQRWTGARLGQQGEFLTLSRFGPDDRAPDFRIADASSMVRGESELDAAGAVVRVAGGRLPTGGDCGLSLVAVFDSGEAEPWEFYCWRGQAGGRTAESSPIRFTVPALGGGFRFRFETWGGPARPSPADLTLTPGWGWLRPKLRQGIYFVAGLRDSDRRLPDWSDHRLRAVAFEGPGRRFRLESQSGQAADFPFLTLVVAKT